MPSEMVKDWFGDQFNKLHPALQQLHRIGGRLTGDVKITYGRGIAGVLGRRLAKKMNFPNEGLHQLSVNISHDRGGLHWARSFDGRAPVESLFNPVGNINDGYWLETTGPLQMRLTVDIIKGGWFWRCLNVKFLGLPVPQWLLPRTDAYKTIENGKYRFHVAFSLPLMGTLVSYRGLLVLENPSECGSS